MIEALRDRPRLVTTWRAVVALGWPITVQSAVRTGMRTTDLLVVGLFGSEALAALGLANLYTRVALVIGLGLGAGALSLASQDTGSGARANRNEAVSVALALGAALGVPVAVLAVAVPDLAIGVLGAPPAVVALGAPYLAIVLGTAPARHVTLIGERALQGTGDTRTPMYVRGGSNIANVVGTVVLGLGVGPAPRLEVVGVALATAGANVAASLAVVAVVVGARTDLALVRPTDPVVARQVLTVGLPRTVQGLSRTVATFPLAAVLVGFGVEVFAAYQVGQRVSQQVTAPLGRSYNVVAGVLVGQALGAGSPERARFEVGALAVFGLLTTAALAAAVAVFRGPLAGAFVDDPATLGPATAFVAAFAAAAVLRTLSRIYAGALQGGGETTQPFLAELVGGVGVLLGVTYVGGVVLDFGVVAAYVAVVLSGAVRLALVAGWFRDDAWVDAARAAMDARGSLDGG